jgi:hypothetical protein
MKHLMLVGLALAILVGGGLASETKHSFRGIVEDDGEKSDFPERMATVVAERGTRRSFLKRLLAGWEELDAEPGIIRQLRKEKEALAGLEQHDGDDEAAADKEGSDFPQRLAMAAKEATETTHHLLRKLKEMDFAEKKDVAFERRRLQTATVNPFDIVFMVDESGSMSDEQNALKTNIPSLFSQLATQAPGSRAGLVGYGGSSTAHPSAPHLHTVITDNQSTFQTAANTLVAAGSVEPGYWTTYATVTNVVKQGTDINMGFTLNRPFCVVLFTDEPSNGDNTVTQQDAINALKNTPTNEANAQGTFFGVTTGSTTGTSYAPIATATGGQMLSLASFVSNTAEVLQAIVTGCNFAVNQISLSPPTASVPYENPVHTLIIGTNQLNGGVVTPKPNTAVVLKALDGPNANDELYRGQTDGSGVFSVAYNPLTTNSNWTGTIHFQVCLQSNPSICATAEASWAAPINKPPVATDDTYIAQRNTDLTVASPGVLSNDSDPDGNTLTVVVANSQTTSTQGGTIVWNADGSFVYTPKTDFSGSDAFTYQISDGRGGTDTATVNISVNAPPVAGDDAYNTLKGTPLPILISNLLINDSDPENDSLIFDSFTPPAHGVVVKTDGTLTYTPDPGFSGSDTFTYEISDGKGGTDTATVTITVIFCKNNNPLGTKDDGCTDAEPNCSAADGEEENSCYQCENKKPPTKKKNKRKKKKKI